MPFMYIYDKFTRTFFMVLDFHPQRSSRAEDLSAEYSGLLSFGCKPDSSRINIGTSLFRDVRRYIQRYLNFGLEYAIGTKPFAESSVPWV